MTSRAELNALVDRVEREEPSRKLDALIHCAVKGRVTHPKLPVGYTMAANGGEQLARAPYIFSSRGPSPAYTTSIDAAASLMPQNPNWAVQIMNNKPCRVYVHDVSRLSATLIAYGEGSDEPRARTAAALRARAQEAKDE